MPAKAGYKSAVCFLKNDDRTRGLLIIINYFQSCEKDGTLEQYPRSPAPKLMNASTDASTVKARSQFRISIKNLPALYDRFTLENF
jgi:hypothetical protein